MFAWHFISGRRLSDALKAVRAWNFAFVTSTTPLGDFTLHFKKANVEAWMAPVKLFEAQVKAGTGSAQKRPVEPSIEGEQKKPRVIPVLKELRDRIKNSKKSFEGNALEKSAPLMQRHGLEALECGWCGTGR